MTVFVDTSAFYALLDADDADHGAAVRVFDRLAAARARLVTHQYVVVETVALAQRRLGIPAVRRFIDSLLPIVDVTPVDRELHAASVDALLANARRGISLVDWTSFLFMRRRSIEQAFAFDDDFGRQGFRRIR